MEESTQILEARASWIRTWNRNFIILNLVSAFLVVIFLFYFNRIFAAIVSYLIRAYCWHRHKVYLDIRAIQVSVLGGRIFFKDVRYHGQNETIRVIDGFVTWRYWLWRVDQTNLTRSNASNRTVDQESREKSGESSGNALQDGEHGTPAPTQQLPCRIHIKARGAEWCIYNRSPAYDAVLATLTTPRNEDIESPLVEKTTSETAGKRSSETAGPTYSRASLEQNTLSMASPKPEGPFESPKTPSKEVPRTIDTSGTSNTIVPTSSSPLSLYLKALPITFELSRVGMVLGNQHTRSMIVAKADGLTGRIDARASGPLDNYQQAFDLNYIHPTVQFKQNEDFREGQLHHAAQRAHGYSKASAAKYSRFRLPFNLRRVRHKAVHYLSNVVPYFRRSVESLMPNDSTTDARQTGAGVLLQNRWLGLSRYLEDDEEGQVESERWKAVEYGQHSTILDCPSISLCFFWDDAGVVAKCSAMEDPSYCGDINGAEPPRWGLHLKIGGGHVTYGPWADRQRSDIQSMFLPPSYIDAQVTPPLRAGQKRLSTSFKITVELDDSVTLRIPTRENSKDWRWKGKTTDPPASNLRHGTTNRQPKREMSEATPELRQAGWLDLTVSRDSAITYTLDMYAGSKGFHNRLDLDLRQPEMSTSINHGVLWRSNLQTISCDLSVPLGWNTLRNWHVDVCSERLELFLLRDHVFLISDLISDWASGPSPEYLAFVPFNYTLSLQMPDFRIYLNANDSNIVNSPTDLEDNTLLVIWGEKLATDILIPLVNYQPDQTMLTFSIDAAHGGLKLLTPTWNTQHTLLDSEDVASLQVLRVNSCYNYHSASSSTLTDTLTIDIHGYTPKIQLYGFLVRYLIKIKDNYFGEDFHFQTSEEYQAELGRGEANCMAKPEAVVSSRISNDLDVILSVTADDATLMLPSNLYSAKEHITLELSTISLDLRYTNYFMDLEAIFSPLSATRTNPYHLERLAEPTTSNTQAFVDGIVIRGHRLFGLPPVEATYVCNWEFDVGNISGELKLESLASFFAAVQCLAFSFGDVENALPPLKPPILHDVTFLRARIKPIQLWLHVDSSAFLLDTQTIMFNFDDWAGERFSDRVHLHIPQVTLSCIDASPASRKASRADLDVTTYAYLQTSIDLQVRERKAFFRNDRTLQQNHIRLQDLRTRRAPWLFRNFDNTDSSELLDQTAKIRAPASAYPPLPEPLRKGLDEDSVTETESDDSSSSRYRRSRTRQSSFLSFPTSVPVASIHRGGNGSSSHSVSTKASPRRALAYFGSLELRPLTPFSRNSSMLQERKENMIDDVPSGILLTSSYISPSFPSSDLKPDTQDVPGGDDEKPPKCSKADWYEDTELSESLNEPMSSTMVMMSLGTGFRGFCTPEALFYVGHLLNSIDPKRPESMLDSLQWNSVNSAMKVLLGPVDQGALAFRLDVPLVRFRLKSHVSTDSRLDTLSYDFALSGLLLNARKSPKAESESSQGQSSLHFSLCKASLGAKGRSSSQMVDQARVDLVLKDLTLWLIKDESTTGRLHFKDLEAISLNQRVDNLTSLLNDTALLVQRISNDFSQTADQQVQRQRILISKITNADGRLPDPVFITGGSYVLRTSRNHARSTDTWKMISRLRFVLRSLGDDQHQQMQADYTGNLSGIYNPAAMQQVIAYFNHWRSWDLAHVRASMLMQKVYGPPRIDSTLDPLPLNLIKMSLGAGNIRLILSPGPSRNHLELERLNVTLVSSDTQTPSAPEAATSAGNDSTVQVACAKTTLHINWEVCELLEGLFDQFKLASTPEGNETAPKGGVFMPTVFQLVMLLEENHLSFDTVNLQTKTSSHRVMASLLATRKAPGEVSYLGITNADQVMYVIQGRSTPVSTCTLRHPNIQMSFVETQLRPPSSKISRKSITLAALCGELDLQIHLDLLGIVAVADYLIDDELAYFQKVIQMVSDGATKPSTGKRVPIGLSTSHPAMNVVLLLDHYKISTMLTPSLRYSAIGSEARSSVSSLPAGGFSLRVDFDIKKLAHGLENQINGALYDIASLPLPAINGQAFFHEKSRNTLLNLTIAIERATLDATALHALLSTISNSKIDAYKNNLIRDCGRLNTHVRAIMGRPATASENPTLTKPFLFNTHLEAAGVGMTFTTIGTRGLLSRISFEIGCIQLSVHNKDIAGDLAIANPEILLRFRHIGVLLERLRGGECSSCGDVSFAAEFIGSSAINESGLVVPSYQLASDGLRMNLYTETASMIVDILGHLQRKFKNIDLSEEVRSLRVRRRLRTKSVAANVMEIPPEEAHTEENEVLGSLFHSMYSLELNDLRVSWKVGEMTPVSPGHESEDLVLSFAKIDLATKRDNAARLVIEELQLQMVPASRATKGRSYNSALLPEVVFNVAYLSSMKDRRLAFQAAGKALDIRLTSQFILPASDLQRSIGIATQELRKVAASWNESSNDGESQARNLLGSKKLSSLLIDMDFAGAVVHVSSKEAASTSYVPPSFGGPTSGRYGQFSQDDATANTTLTAPGIAVKIEYQDMAGEDPSLKAEIKIDASSNILYPTVVPLIMELSSSIKDVVGETPDSPPTTAAKQSPSKAVTDDPFSGTDPAAILGNCRLTLGLRIRRQEFGLSCQPIARVAATARFDDIYITVNTVQAHDQGRFFAVSGAFLGLRASVQHVYSRESTGSFEVDTLTLSLMNSKHVSQTKGLAGIAKISPMKVTVNAKQLHDFLLFREIWIPADVRASSVPPSTSVPETQAFTIQRYQQVAATGAFPWNATLSVEKLDIILDLGQSLGKPIFSVSAFWMSSKKSSDWEQNLCLGFDRLAMDSTGRMSGMIEVTKLRLRTSIQWPAHAIGRSQTPLIQASVDFDELRLKAAFDYQALLTANVKSLGFIMYNVRDSSRIGDRLVGILDCDEVHAFCTTSSAAQGLALYQSIQRLVQEKQTAYENSLRDIEQYLCRKTTLPMPTPCSDEAVDLKQALVAPRVPFQLHTNVIVSVKRINLGAFPKNFFAAQIFKLEALDASAAFSVSPTDAGAIHSGLSLTLGQLRIALSGVSQPPRTNTLDDLAMDAAVAAAMSSRGGTILKIPRVVAAMQTWHQPDSSDIDYVFTSSFEGKVEVGWNYSRISFLRGMWASHTRALATSLGKSIIPPSADVSDGKEDHGDAASASVSVRATDGGHEASGEKITAVVNVPASKYHYRALEPPVIETPQLRDMGEATPPLEWIGLHRDRLPNLTHQIIIVGLLEMAKEVEDAYGKILGSSRG